MSKPSEPCETVASMAIWTLACGRGGHLLTLLTTAKPNGNKSVSEKGGGVDKRSSAVKRGEVTVDKCGMPHGLGPKAKQIIDIEEKA